MPYSKLSEANVKELDGVKLTLGQANTIAKMADAISGEYGWPTAIKHFKRNHTISKGKWIVNEVGKREEKGIQEIIIEKEEDGRYKIIGVSTAAVKDREGEEFTTAAIDFDIAMAEETGTYPEFRLLHKKFLAVGQVEKMSRIGIFAIDEGYAYDDPFSQEVCEVILKENDGQWRMSRGFYVIQASGGCPRCGEGLLVETKHMIAGFSCPTCKSIHSGYKGTLNDVKFHKTRTFDVTITDKPCVPMTGVAAFRVSTDKEVIMTKKELREKLVDAGLSPDKVDERLKEVDAKQLKELDKLPQAKLLKELELEDEASDGDDDVSDEDLFVLDPEVLKDFSNIVEEQVVNALESIVEKVVKEAIDGLEIDLGDVQVEGIEGMTELVEEVSELKEVVEVLAQSDDERLEQLLKDSPRAAKLRILRRKAGGKKKKFEEEDEGEEEDEDEEEFEEEKQFNVNEGIIVGANGEVAPTMTEFLRGGE